MYPIPSVHVLLLCVCIFIILLCMFESAVLHENANFFFDLNSKKYFKFIVWLLLVKEYESARLKMQAKFKKTKKNINIKVGRGSTPYASPLDYSKFSFVVSNSVQ